MFVSLWHVEKKLAPQETVDYPIENAVEVFCNGKFIDDHFGGMYWDIGPFCYVQGIQEQHRS